MLTMNIYHFNQDLDQNQIGKGFGYPALEMGNLCSWPPIPSEHKASVVGNLATGGGKRTRSAPDLA